MLKNFNIKNILIILILINMVYLSIFLTGCFNSSGGSLNPILLGSSGGSGSGSGTNVNAAPFDDISDNPGVTFVDPDSDFDSSDDGLATLSSALPFNFTLFGSSNSTFTAGSDIYVCTNGWFSFDEDIDTDDFDSFSNIGHLDDVLVGGSYGPYDSFIAPFWDDLDLESGESHAVWYITEGTSPNRRFIIQWYTEGYSQDDNQLIFQAILFEGTNDMQFSYAIMRDVNGDDSMGNSGAVNGSGATIGVMVGNDNEPEPIQKIYSICIASIPTIPSGQAYYIYFKANGSNYDIYTGFVSAAMSGSLPNILGGSNNNSRNRNMINKPEDNSNFRWFYKTNTYQELLNFVRSNKTNRR